MIQLWSIRIYKEGDERGTLELMKLSGIELCSAAVNNGSGSIEIAFLVISSGSLNSTDK